MDRQVAAVIRAYGEAEKFSHTTVEQAVLEAPFLQLEPKSKEEEESPLVGRLRFLVTSVAPLPSFLGMTGRTVSCRTNGSQAMGCYQGVCTVLVCRLPGCVCTGASVCHGVYAPVGVSARVCVHRWVCLPRCVGTRGCVCQETPVCHSERSALQEHGVEESLLSDRLSLPCGYCRPVEAQPKGFLVTSE